MVVVLLTHVAVKKIVPPIRDLPTNVLKGFNETFKFAALSADGLVVADNAKKAMQTCHNPAGYDFSLCQTAPSFTPFDKKSTTQTYLDAINGAFDRTLSVILKVSTDECLKAEGFNSTATELQKIMNFTTQIQAADMPCLGSWGLYCGIYESGKALSTGAGDALIQIDNMTKTEAVKKVTDHLDKLNYLHGLPYVLVVSLLFFSCFWYFSGGVCCCCEGGNCKGVVCCLFPHITLWLAYLVLAAVIVAVGFLVPKFAKETKNEFGGGTCTIAETMSHIEKEYAAFYDFVLRDLIKGCLLFVRAFRAALAMCLFIGGYALLICLCRPYNREKKEIGRPLSGDTE